eukprot:6832869-Alexandrium_andersonii.AAC.1
MFASRSRKLWSLGSCVGGRGVARVRASSRLSLRRGVRTDQLVRLAAQFVLLSPLVRVSSAPSKLTFG